MFILRAMKFLSANAHRACFIIVLLILPVTGLAASLDSQAREGVSLYNREEYAEAAAKFQASQLEQPDQQDVAYNLANSLYRLGRYEEAAKAYQKALTEKTPPDLKQKSYFNQGNAYYRMGYLDEAMASYKKALELDPKDVDSKFNLEWTRQQYEKALKAGRIAPRDKNNSRKSTGKGNNPPDPQEKSEDSADAQSENNKANPTADNQAHGKPGPSEKTPSATQPGFPGKGTNEVEEKNQAVQDALREMAPMTPEEAELWLGSLSEDLKKITRRQMQGQMKDMFADHDKDW